MAQGITGNPFVIGVDIDDTLTSYTERFLEIHGKRYGVDPVSLTRPDSYTKWGFGWPGIETEADYFKHHNDYVRNEGMFSGAKTFEYAREALRNLREAGAYVKVITTRFCSPEFADKDFVIEETSRFLGNNKLEYDEFMISSTKDQIHADAYVDDSPSNVEKFVRAGKTVIVPNTTLYTAPLAERFGVPLAQDWREIESILMGLMDQHHGHNPMQETLFDMAA